MEKKKIQPKTKLNAQQQEALLQTLQQNTADAVNLQQNTANAVNLQQNTADAVNLQQNTADAVNLQQSTAGAVNLQQSTASAASGKTQRITVDMPLELYERMKSELDYNGQSIKGLIVGLVRGHFDKK